MSKQGKKLTLEDIKDALRSDIAEREEYEKAKKVVESYETRPSRHDLLEAGYLWMRLIDEMKDEIRKETQ